MEMQGSQGVCIPSSPADKQQQDRRADSNFRISECLEKERHKIADPEKGSVRNLAALTLAKQASLESPDPKRACF